MWCAWWGSNDGGLYTPRILRVGRRTRDRKSTRLNSSHSQISYAVFCLKKKKDRVRQNQKNAALTSTRRQTAPRILILLKHRPDQPHAGRHASPTHLPRPTPQPPDPPT